MTSELLDRIAAQQAVWHPWTLLAASNLDFAASLRESLGLMGLQLIVTCSLSHAERTVADWRPSIVFCELASAPPYPVGLLAKLGRNKPASTQLIAIIGHGTARDVDSLLAAGVDHVLVRPLFPEEFLRLLVQLTEPPRMSSERT